MSLDDTTGNDVALETPGELIAHVATQIVSHKKPHRVLSMEDVPKSAVGKFQRNQLRDYFSQYPLAAI